MKKHQIIIFSAYIFIIPAAFVIISGIFGFTSIKNGDIAIYRYLKHEELVHHNCTVSDYVIDGVKDGCMIGTNCAWTSRYITACSQVLVDQYKEDYPLGKQWEWWSIPGLVDGILDKAKFEKQHSHFPRADLFYLITTGICMFIIAVLWIAVGIYLRAYWYELH